MRRSSRDRLIISLLGLSAVVVGCSRLTSIDWGLIPLATGGTSVGTPSGGAAGEESGGASEVTPVGEAAGETSGGEGGGGGEPANVSGGTGGTGGGGGGTGGVGNGGMSGSGGNGGGGGVSGGGGGTAGSAGTGGTGGIPPCMGTTGPLDNALVLFVSPSKPTGNRGGRVGLDADCEAERIKQGLTQTKTHAFISVDSNDYLANWGTPQLFSDLPKTRRIVGPTGIEVAASWSEMLLTGAERSLICAEVLTSDGFWWLSGVNSGAALINGQNVYGQPGADADTCKSWTVGTRDPLIRARPGSAEFAGRQMLAAAHTGSEDKTFFIDCDHTANFPTLCLAYTP